jgi:polysaccharide deacetylase 2 family uncharacterized protein YibQ
VTDDGASQVGSESAIELPPRRETWLARYSRRSKLIGALLTMVSLVAVSYITVSTLSRGEGGKGAGHHVPSVHSADRGAEQAQPSEGSTSTAEQGASAASEGGGSGDLNPQNDHTVTMAQAPDPQLTENTPEGDLPKISEDGRQPWQVYARPFNSNDKRPKLAIVVADLGLSRTITAAAATRLPAGVTLAFDVQGPVVASWCARARQQGHETLLSVPMEPFDYPRSDPGPHTLLSTLSDSANLERLNWALEQGVGYVGITTMTGSRFTTDSSKLGPVFETLRQRGLMVLDPHIAPHSVILDIAHEKHVPVAVANERIEDNLSPEAIDQALQQLEQAARLDGKALGIVPAVPIVIDHLEAWLKKLPSDGIALAPVSAVIQ